MNTYKYSALSPDGAKVNGVVDAVDEYAAVRRIKTDCPVVLSISEVKEQAGVVKFLNSDIGGKKVDLKSLSVMCSQFHIIMGSGVPVDAAIRMIAQQTVDKNLRRMLEKSADDVSQGTPMSVAFSKNYPQLPTLFIETVRAGEISGTIDRSFGTLEKYYEKTYKLQQKVKAALSYPLFVLGVAIVVLIVVMGFVMPTFTSIFKDLGADLPMITVVLISITNFFQKWWALILAVIALAIILLEVWKHSDQGRLQWAKFVLRAPVFGNISCSGCRFLSRFISRISAMRASTFSPTSTSIISAGYRFLRFLSSSSGTKACVIFSWPGCRPFGSCCCKR